MRRILSLVALSLLVAAPSQAQKGHSSVAPASNSVEFGVDGAVMHSSMTGSSFTETSLPLQRLRVGFFVSPQISIEPAFQLSSISGGGASLTQYSLGSGLLYHFTPNRNETQLYVRPFFDLIGISGGASAHTTDAGVGLGAKFPMAERFATRAELTFGHTAAEGTNPSSNQMGMLFGFSFLTH
jgi:hypothetical protein